MAWPLKRHFTSGMILVLLCLAGCQKDSESPDSNPARRSVSLLHYFSGSLSLGVSDLSERFNAQSPLFSLHAVSLDHEAFKSSILDTLQSGHPPEIYSYWAGARTASVVDHLEPLDDLWQELQLEAQFSKPLIEAAAKYRGKTYLLPVTQHVVGFFYNKALFDRHELKIPDTWPQFLALCERLKELQITPIALGARDKWPAQFWFDLMLLRTAPWDFRQKLMRGEASYGDPEVIRVFKQWSELLHKGYFNPASTELSWDEGANELVFTGKAAMTLMGTWNIGYFTNADHKWRPEIDFGFFPFPTIDPAIAPVALGPIDGLIIPRNAPNMAGAKAVLGYLAQAEPQQRISAESGALSPLVQVPPGFYNRSQLLALQEVRRCEHFAFNYDLATLPDVAALGLNAFSEFLVFPDAYPDILEQLAIEVDTVLGQQAASPGVRR
jgi:ABC-type glycerol-3-phosphate transport system substrate-binding protein